MNNNQSEKIHILHFGKRIINPKISVIIVTYNTANELKDCLESLKNQTFQSYEVILLNNGQDIEYLKGYNLIYIPFDINIGASKARNIGAKMARGKVIAFLDDDGIAQNDWLENIWDTMSSNKIVGVRGKIVPKNESIYNVFAGHYNLGDKILPWFIDLEGNCAFLKKQYNEVGGFNKNYFSGEGIDLSYRLSKNTILKIIYNPKIIIKHDYSDSLLHFIEKNFRNGKNNFNIEKSNQNFASYLSQFRVKSDIRFNHTFNFLEKILHLVLKTLAEKSYLFGRWKSENQL